MSIKDTLQSATDALGLNPNKAPEDEIDEEKKRRAQATTDSTAFAGQPYIDSSGLAGGSSSTDSNTQVASAHPPTDISSGNAFTGASAGVDAGVGQGSDSSFDGVSADASGSVSDSGGGDAGAGGDGGGGGSAGGDGGGGGGDGGGG